MYEIKKSDDGKINVIKNNKELFDRVMHEDNVQIMFIPEGERPNLIFIAEDLATSQTVTFYDADGKYITGLCFNNNAFLASLKDKPIHIIDQDSDEYRALVEQNEEINFFSFIAEPEAFSFFIKNDFTRIIPAEQDLKMLNKLPKQPENFFAYSYFGDFIAKARLKNEAEADEYLTQLLETDSELLN